MHFNSFAKLILLPYNFDILINIYRNCNKYYCFSTKWPYICISKNNKYLLIMKKNTTKSLKWLTGFTTIIGALYLLLLGCQTYRCFFDYPAGQVAVWMDDCKLLQGNILVFKLIGAVATYGCIISFLLNSIGALKNGTIFPRKNVKILFGTAVSSFIFIVCNSNTHIVFGERQIQLDLIEIIVPVVICAFAII